MLSFSDQGGPGDSCLCSVVVLTYRRDPVLGEMLSHLRGAIGERTDCEVLLVDNNEDGLDRGGMLSGFARSLYIKLKGNRGVAGGRNEGIRRASGEYLVFLDDDAFVYPPGFPELIHSLFEQDPKLGVLAMKIMDYDTMEVQRSEFPHTDKSLDPEEPFRTFRFIGAGHAIRKCVFEKVGLYREDFFFGMEEFDLSYAVINGGFEILYHPGLWVRHMRAREGRVGNARLQELCFINKLKIGHRHLPTGYFVLNSVVWGGAALLRSGFRVNPLSCLTRFLRWKDETGAERKPLSAEAIGYIKACGGSIWR